MNLDFKKPCGNCPFKKKGAIELREGRVAQIARELIENDQVPFVCHKTVHGPKADGKRIEHEDGSSSYIPGRRDSVCAGSMIFLLKAGAPNVSMRMGAALGLLNFQELRSQFDDIVDPEALLGDETTDADQAREA